MKTMTAEKAPTMATESQPSSAPLVIRAEPVDLPAAPSVEWLKATLSATQIKTLMLTVAPNATEDELAAFLWVCRRRRLDPFLRQVHFVKRRRYSGRDSNGKPQYEDVATYQTGIDGLRVVASREKDPDGSALLNGIKRGAIRDKDGMLIGAWAEVYRKDWAEPAREEIRLEEYQQTVERTANGKSWSEPAGLWKTKPETMAKKCAEAAALRMAFPEDLGDLYIHEEMDSAEHVPAVDGRQEAPPLSSRDVAVPVPTDAVLTPTPTSTSSPSSSSSSAPTSTSPSHPEDGPATRALMEGPANPFAEEPEDQRPALLAEIKAIATSFNPPPRATTWEALAQHFCHCSGTDLPKADPAALTDLLGFFRSLQAGEKQALGLLTQILKPGKK